MIGPENTLWQQLIKIDKRVHISLQLQIRQQIIDAILSQRIVTGSTMPSSRRLSLILNIARNTVVLAYERLKFDGYLDSKQRQGYFVKTEFSNKINIQNEAKDSPSWCQTSLVKTAEQTISSLLYKDWKKLEYPFVSGQLDQALAPINQWREAVKLSSSAREIKQWNIDYADSDDPMLIQQIQKNILPKRGIWAQASQILLSSGTQNAIYMIASLLIDANKTVGIENPGYPDVKNIFDLKTNKLSLIELDEQGLIVDSINPKCDLIYTTPNHQYPTGVTLSAVRRKQLLDKAEEDDFVIIEDDYEAENNFTTQPSAALKSIDKNARVIYVGSFSKTFSPGLRLGYIVAPAEFIQQLRALRRLMLRHMPTNNQRAMAFFISLGYYNNMFNLIHATYQQRWHLISKIIKQTPLFECAPTFGGSSFWITLPRSIDSEKLRLNLLKQGVAIQSGNLLFFQKQGHKNYIRLGYCAIKTQKINKGMQLLIDEVGWLTHQ